MTYRCRQCGHVFYGGEELGAHLLSEHGLGRAPVDRSLANLYDLVEALQLEVKSQGDNLGDHLVEHLKLEKRVADLETQMGLERAMEES